MWNNEPGYPGSTAIVDLHKMDRNLDYLKQKSGVQEVLAVVKVDAYKHGAIAVARHLEPKLAGFAVACLDEAIELREAGIKKEILVFGVPLKKQAGIYLEYDLSATISHIDHFRVLQSGTSYHINFDTGMRRIGLYPKEAGEVVVLADKYPKLHCKGVYSHYATADDPGSDFVMEQHKRFINLRKSLPSGWRTHMSNTAAVLHYDVEHFDMIRIGIGLTGYAPGKKQSSQLQPALTWTSKIVNVREISRGDTVSYAATWTCPKEGYIGTIPVGYGDGIPRSLSNKLEVLVGDTLVPSVGNVTMDYIMIFLEDEPVPAGTDVTLLGGNGLRANIWAERAGSITHEILCGITPRVARTYIGDR